MKLHQYIGVFLVILGITSLVSLGVMFGEHCLQSKIESRMLELNDQDCYSWQDLEVAVFGEIQE